MTSNFSSGIWILDSGASYHYSQSMEGLTEAKEIDESIMIGNGDSMKAIMIENLKCTVTQMKGEKFTVALNDVKYVSNLCVNSYSLSKALKKGFNVSNYDVLVSFNYKHVKLTFDYVINAKDGFVTGVLIRAKTFNNINGFANASTRNERYYDINYVHKFFGYCGQ
jgi:hypothetical protein